MKTAIFTWVGAAGFLFGGSGFLAAEVDSYEKDREAILGMVGKFEVEFNFEETVSLVEGYELREPYQEEALEWVKLVEDRGKLIVLQHILLADDGLEVHVVKHWGQIWKYEDSMVLDYAGGKEWEKKEFSSEEVKGTWTQLVTQTDDSPRYESSGKWVHEGNRSVWQSQVTNRPLPRREYKKRSDYDVLVAVNRHVLTPDGWVHEQENRKWNIREERFLCHEQGLNRYKRCEEDFALAEEQWEKTKDFWHDVRMAWAVVIREEEKVAYAKEIDGKSLGRRMNGLAKRVARGETVRPSEVDALIEEYTTAAK